MLKGKTEAVDAFEPVGDSKAKYISEYLKAFELMQNEDSSAATAFSDISRLYPRDSLVAFHRERLVKNDLGARILLAEK